MFHVAQSLLLIYFDFNVNRQMLRVFFNVNRCTLLMLLIMMMMILYGISIWHCSSFWMRRLYIYYGSIEITAPTIVCFFFWKASGAYERNPASSPEGSVQQDLVCGGDVSRMSPRVCTHVFAHWQMCLHVNMHAYIVFPHQPGDNSDVAWCSVTVETCGWEVQQWHTALRRSLVLTFSFLWLYALKMGCQYIIGLYQILNSFKIKWYDIFYVGLDILRNNKVFARLQQW